MKPISIMFADDHPVFLKSVTSLFKSQTNFNILGLAANGQELLDLVKHKQPDVAIIDLEMPVLDGFKTIEALNVNFPTVKSIIYSTHYERFIAKELILLGARGYISKSVDIDVFVDTIINVYNNGYCIDACTSKYILASGFKLEIQKLQFKQIGLSNKESKILQLICQEKTNATIANELKVSVSTIDFHRRNIYKKTNKNSIVGLVKYAINNCLA